MSDKVRLTLVQDPVIIRDNWGFYSDGIESVLNKANGDSSLSTIYTMLLKGQIHLYLAYVGTEYVGLVTVRFVDVPQGARYIELLHGYLKPGVDYGRLFESFDAIEDIAVKYNYSSIRFYTERDKAFERKLGEVWRKGYTQFIKEVPNGR